MSLEHIDLSFLQLTTVNRWVPAVILLVVLGLLRWFPITEKLSIKRDRREAPAPLSKKLASSSGKLPQREYGDWKPIEFSYPKFSPCDVKLEDKLPLPYRPFRWGPYHITMGIRNMGWEDWIEIDSLLPQYYAIRAERARDKSDKLIRVLPARPGVASAAPAAKELVYEIAEFLTRRYPEVYSAKRHPPVANDFGWYGDGQIKEVTINSLGVTHNLDNEDPMTVAALLIQDDLAIMIEGSDGRYYFQGGAILVPGFWRLEDKIGMPLEDIHTTGKVPQYQEKLQLSMGRFFCKLALDKPVQRNNYFFQIVRPLDDPYRQATVDSDELAWSDTTNGNEDTFGHRIKEFRPVGHVHDKEPKPASSAEDIRLRTERQTLRRLPRTGAIVFTIRTYIFPIVDLAKEPGIPGRMASAIRSWPDDVVRYKGQRLYRDAILPYLDAKHDEQVQSGVFVEGEQMANYPF